MIIFIVPSYNEEKNIGLLMEKTKKKMDELIYQYKIVIVNDGSTDKTIEIIESFKEHMPVEVISHYPNKGVKEAFAKGFKYALEIAKDDDIIVTKEADNSSNLNILETMIKNVEKGEDVVLASCFAKDGKIENATFDRLFLSWCANTLIKMFFHMPAINTFSSFYRAYNVGSLKRAFFAYDEKLLTYNGFVTVVEMLIKLNRLPVRISEVPMVLYDSRVGESKMIKYQTIWGYFKLIWYELSRNRKLDDLVLKRFQSYSHDANYIKK